MRPLLACLGVTGVLSVLPCERASAQQALDAFLSQQAPPPHLLELALGTGYVEGFGSLGPGRALEEAAGTGVALSALAEVRPHPSWAIGVEARYQGFANGNSPAGRGLAVSAGVTWHVDPALRGDPWLRFATGYQGLWQSDPGGSSGTTIRRHGLDLLTAALGYDVRILGDLALAPVIGADLDLFLWDDSSPRMSANSAGVGTLVYVGVQARFGVGGVPPLARRWAPE